MDMRNFLLELEKIGMGIVAFNTYNLQGENCFYLMVAKKGDRGKYLKIEGKAAYIDDTLDDFMAEILCDTNIDPVSKVHASIFKRLNKISPDRLEDIIQRMEQLELI